MIKSQAPCANMTGVLGTDVEESSMDQATADANGSSRQSRHRMKINARCEKCGRRMFRGTDNRAYCASDGSTSTGPSSTPKGTVSTVPKIQKGQK